MPTSPPVVEQKTSAAASKKGSKKGSAKLSSVPILPAEAPVRVASVILTLRCHLSDLAVEPPPARDPRLLVDTSNPEQVEQAIQNLTTTYQPTVDLAIVTAKLNALTASFNLNCTPNADGHKSDCFWCTCPFDTPPVYLPKHRAGARYDVYGNYCSPSCAAAHLLSEQIDSSVRACRLELLNSLYNPVYDSGVQTIRPAPDPRYLLSKYLGNLSIDEYRSLTTKTGDRLIHIIEKPMTRIMPELHDDNTSFVLYSTGPAMNRKRAMAVRKVKDKGTVMAEKFGGVCSTISANAASTN